MNNYMKRGTGSLPGHKGHGRIHMEADPVCLMTVDPRRAAAMVEYGGRAYYFCSLGCRERFVAQPDTFLRKRPGMRLTVGVMGSADLIQIPNIKEKAYALGKAIGEHGFVLITGACPGLPYACARGAREAGGLSVGISPALSLDEHVHRYLSPADAFDVIVYTGSGLMGREVTNIRSSDVVIILGGRSGTLGEFAIAYDEGKLIGVLQGTGGITDHLPHIIESFGTKNTGARIVYEANPEILITKLSESYAGGHYRRPSTFCEDHVSTPE
jgi:uncharacterized protein (TIGR00725 family)